MAVLRRGRAHRQQGPDLRVDNELEPGRWRFRLVTVDASGRQSRPAEIVVTVRAREARPEPVDAGRLRIDRDALRRVDLDPDLGPRRPVDRRPEPDPDPAPRARTDRSRRRTRREP